MVRNLYYSLVSLLMSIAAPLIAALAGACHFVGAVALSAFHHISPVDPRQERFLPRLALLKPEGRTPAFARTASFVARLKERWTDRTGFGVLGCAPA